MTASSARVARSLPTWASRKLGNEKIDTAGIITHSASLDGIAGAIERVVGREDGVIKTVIKP